ncbi:MAG: ABC-2 family transporter protein [Blautia sp.]|nr:ABC-2 family transporter protein [Blautia sp.]MCM1202438.1 ABC-2 family transporter protein [Bacteroides fragilis]
MKKISSSIKLYRHYVSITVRCMMQYKTSFFLTAAGQFLISFNVFLGIFFMFRRFSSVDGFSYSEVLLCFAIILLEFSFAEMFARGFDLFPNMVRSGDFDRIMVRPQNEILQVLGSKFELTRIGRMLQAAVMFVYGIVKCDVVWDFSRIMTVVFMLIGGTAVFSGLFLIYAALCFFTLDGLEFMNVFTDGAREFCKYPLGIYGKKMLLMTTFAIPYTLIQYYPLLYLLGRRTSALYIFLPLCACLFLVPAALLWKFGVRHYASSGS